MGKMPALHSALAFQLQCKINRGGLFYSSFINQNHSWDTEFSDQLVT